MVLGFFSFNWKKLKYINSNGERTVYQLHPHKKERYKALRHYKNQVLLIPSMKLKRKDLSTLNLTVQMHNYHKSAGSTTKKQLILEGPKQHQTKNSKTKGLGPPENASKMANSFLSLPRHTKLIHKSSASPQKLVGALQVGNSVHDHFDGRQKYEAYGCSTTSGHQITRMYTRFNQFGQLQESNITPKVYEKN